MTSKRPLLYLAAGIAVVSLLLVILANLPQATTQFTHAFPTTIQTSAGTSFSLQHYTITLTSPQSIYLGAFGKVDLLVEPKNADGSTQSSDLDKLYQQYNPVIDTRLELVGMTVQPNDQMSEPLGQNKPVQFEWQLFPTQDGSLSGTLWIYMSLVPKGGGTAESLTLFALPITSEGKDLMGMAVGTVYVLAGVGGLLAIGLAAYALFPRRKKKWQKRR
jgi:hypothetical protein